MSTIGNIIWILLGGIWMSIPFGIQHFKLAGISLMPVGKTIVPKEMAARLR